MTTTPFLSSLEGYSSTDLDSPLTATVGADGLAPTSKRSTALTAKLTSVLSLSYSDHEIRDVLRILDSRAISNDEDTRRALKADAQREVIECNARIVDDFGVVALQLQRVGEMIATLNSTCAAMRSHVLAAKDETMPMLEEAHTLMTRSAENDAKEDLLKAFNAHFLVDDDELDVLTSSAQPLDDRFFTALERVKKIHADCSLLLGYNSTSQQVGDAEEDEHSSPSSRLGLELLESTTRTLDASFKKLYTWIQSRFKTLDIEDPHISGSIRHALRVLSERPSLFQNCLDFFAEARIRTLSEAFQDALTGGVAGGAGVGGKAIEFSTHEPLRYVGDMLAWVHSAAVSEKEALEGLFVGDEEEIVRGLREGRSSEPWARISSTKRAGNGPIGSVSNVDNDQDDEGAAEEDVFDGRKALSDLIARNLSLVCQTLQSRIDITVRTSGDPILTFKVFNLLDFYRGIFAKLLDGEESTLSQLIRSLQSSTLEQFEKAMDEETSAAVAALNLEPAHDLTPPAILATILAQFGEVCRARGPQMDASELERLFASMLSGILTACAETGTQIIDKRRSSIYKLNYMTTLRATLATTSTQVPAVQLPLSKAATEIQSLRDHLVDFVATTFHEYSGVADLTQEIDARRTQHQPHELRKWLRENLDEAAQRLDEFLSSALMDAQEALKPLLDRTLAKDVVAEAVERFCAEFEELEGLLEGVEVETAQAGDKAEDEEGTKDDVNGPDGSLRDLYPRTGAEVRALLS